MRKSFLILLSCCLIGIGIFVVWDRIELFQKIKIYSSSLVGKLNFNPNRTEYSEQGYSVFYWDGQNYKEEEKDISSLTEVITKPKQEIDFDYDGENEKVVLDNGVVSIYRKGEVWWQSDPDWQVENVLLADLNWDGKIELNMSLWKQGSYGDDLPFWIEENDSDFGNHFFIYGFKEGEIRPIWCSSTIDYPIHKMAASDINGDGKDELVVLEGTYDQPQDSLTKYVGIWSWNDWGFSNDFRSEEDQFCDLKIRKDLDNKNCVLVKNKP